MQPVVEELEEDTPTWEVDELDSSSPESERPPPPGFPPFVFPEDDGGMNADEIYAQFGRYVAGTCQHTDTRLCDIPEETEAPELVVPGPPSPNDMSDVMPMVGYALTVGEQWCDARTHTDVCLPSDNGTGYTRREHGA